MDETFTPTLENKSSPEFKALEEKVTKALDAVFKVKFGPAFNKTVIKGFSKGSVKADTELIFNEEQTVPNVTSVSDTLVEATSSSNFSLSVNTSSIVTNVVVMTTVAPSTITSPTVTTFNVTSPPPTNMTSPPPTNMTSPPTNMTSAPKLEPKIKLEFKMDETFTPSLENKSSPEFKALEEKVTKALDAVFKVKFGPAFNKTVIKGFSKGSVKADTELIFNEEQTVPNVTSVSDTLVEATSSSNFSLSVNTSSIVTNVVVMTTVAPTTITSPTVTTAPKLEPKIKLEFKMDETFTPTLENKSSPEFKALEEKVTKALDAVFKVKFGPAFNKTVIKGFSKGSVKADTELIFNEEQTVPNVTSVSDTLVEATSSSNFSLSVNTSSIVTNGHCGDDNSCPNYYYFAHCDK
ncbi:mucin-2-like [Boleophthalmus pectinirostris]|uniref:mucin-2-like n=1 Tax=Boleophthalmus pectinirostris TaxID=150288 RepID=UPI00242D336B|nr:mucin-2-like [Boleophthalmus pectinirostris]